jgi:hypothetical protein
MAKKYIRINSIEDIDTSRINISNINDRYVDNKGNRFATRFNLRTKKIQIVRIALGEEEAKKSRGIIIQGLVQKKIDEGKKKPHEEQHAPPIAETIGKVLDNEEIQAPDLFELETVGEFNKKDITGPVETSTGTNNQPSSRKNIPDWLIEAGISPAKNVNFGELLALIPENYNLLSERIFGIINNVKNSGVMSKLAEIDDAIDFTNIFDHQINPKMEETKKYLLEFDKYAERPDHYFTMIEKPFRTYLMEISESEVMDFLRAYFIGQSALSVLENTRLFIQSVRGKTSMEIESIPDPAKKQFLQYAYSTCDFLATYVNEEGSKILGWMTEQKIF